jgi:hypothetical protein
MKQTSSKRKKTEANEQAVACSFVSVFERKLNLVLYCEWKKRGWIFEHAEQNAQNGRSMNGIASIVANILQNFYDLSSGDDSSPGQN